MAKTDQQVARIEILAAIGAALPTVEGPVEGLLVAMREYLVTEQMAEQPESEASATVQALHSNWRTNLERVVGPRKAMRHSVERAVATAEVTALKHGRKVGEK